MKRFVIYLFIAFLFFSCTKENRPEKSTPKAPITLTKSQEKVNEAVGEFSWKFLSELLNECEECSNVLISPYSIDMAISMLLQGASGSTLEQMKIALCVEDLSKEEIADYFCTMSSALVKADSKVKFTDANSLWTRDV